jgi:hypothetical protein
MLPWFPGCFPFHLPIVVVGYLDDADCTRCLCSLAHSYMDEGTYEVTIRWYDLLPLMLSLVPPYALLLLLLSLVRDMSFWVGSDRVYDLLIPPPEPSFRIPAYQLCSIENRLAYEYIPRDLYVGGDDGTTTRCSSYKNRPTILLDNIWATRAQWSFSPFHYFISRLRTRLRRTCLYLRGKAHSRIHWVCPRLRNRPSSRSRPIPI